ncbi:helicase-exonuclease AddAB subunit AddA [Exiguobacterium sp. AM39-5BH]|uniref:helicase-exonuclease AddAB subunit AddA n=1 Tax=Exiguobacterium sp. AM39-5BH TaxID=2292355 RepID=UPI000FE26B34|nr:helicase-exonuclease AddAB subunit AddA [Exiguobacterium sp. AM39-5BH]RHB46603.1 helicase-exonuclease AddAB subunit AddA [Exiguobacterium sp. AM39-5BH]
MKWTNDQQAAIDTRGSHVLVSAAAGSGKTAVLVERLASRLLDESDELTADRMLVVTFTNAAAAEMKRRIAKALDEALRNDPENTYIRKQRQMLNRALITTIHSFCLEVIRENYYLLDLDPAFKIAEERDLVLLQDDVLEDVLEDAYGEQDHAFFALIDAYTSDRGDSEIEELILGLYHYARTLPDPEAYLDELISLYQFDGDPDDEQLLIEFGHLLWVDIEKALRQLRRVAIELRLAGYEAQSENVQQAILPFANLDPDSFKWSELETSARSVKFGTMKSVQKKDEHHVYHTVLKPAYDQAKKKLSDAIAPASTSGADYLEVLMTQRPLVETLVKTVRTFGAAYEQAKRERAFVDFSDLEHYALAILRDGQEPSSVASLYKQRFAEVLIDEYQDTNEIQETIIGLVSNEIEHVGNLFMVGDIKQSIYRFRHAEPRLFIEKATRFKQEGSGQRIDLSQNFRSRAEVLHGINDLFIRLMDEEVSEIDYDEAARLVPGREYEALEANPELILVNGESRDLSKQELEGRAIATRILELVSGEEPFKVTDETTGLLRSCEYRDIVILVRSKKERVEQLMDILTQYNIPAYTDSDGGYFQATEIRMMLAVLKLIDNPLQDIPLAGALRSPMFGFSDQELAKIRLESEDSFFEALKAKADDEDDLGLKCGDVLDALSAWRTFARDHSLSELIQQVFNDTGFYDFAGGLPGGKGRQENLKALYDRALSYERSGYRGLYRFLRVMDRLQDNGEDLSEARSLGEEENVVRIMTVHKSKGLEFPVTIVAQLGKQFNKRDQMQRVIFHKRYGISLDAIDVVTRTKTDTFVKEMIRRDLDATMKAEEMRVLYVALTRAKEKLILVGTIREPGKQIQQWLHVEQTGMTLSADARREAKTYLDWVAPALLKLEGAAPFLEQLGLPVITPQQEATPWTYRIIGEGDLAEVATLQEMMAQLHHVKQFEAIDFPVKDETMIADFVRKAFAYEYPAQAATETAAKQTVTELKRALQLEQAAFEETFRTSDTPYREPKWKQAKQTGAERGTTLHLIFQLINPSEPLDLQINRWEMEGMLSPVEAETARLATPEIEAFFASDTGLALTSALQKGTGWRELPFTYTVPAERVNPTGSFTDERVLIQGIIDCLFYDGETYVLLDYKSDAVLFASESREAAKQMLRDRYHVQLLLYREAIEAIWGIKIGKTLIYSLELQEIVAL